MKRKYADVLVSKEEPEPGSKRFRGKEQEQQKQQVSRLVKTLQMRDLYLSVLQFLGPKSAAVLSVVNREAHVLTLSSISLRMSLFRIWIRAVSETLEFVAPTNHTSSIKGGIQYERKYSGVVVEQLSSSKEARDVITKVRNPLVQFAEDVAPPLVGPLDLPSSWKRKRWKTASVHALVHEHAKPIVVSLPDAIRGMVLVSNSLPEMGCQLSWQFMDKCLVETYSDCARQFRLQNVHPAYLQIHWAVQDALWQEYKTANVFPYVPHVSSFHSQLFTEPAFTSACRTILATGTHLSWRLPEVFSADTMRFLTQTQSSLTLCRVLLDTPQLGRTLRHLTWNFPADFDDAMDKNAQALTRAFFGLLAQCSALRILEISSDTLPSTFWRQLLILRRDHLHLATVHEIRVSTWMTSADEFHAYLLFFRLRVDCPELFHHDANELFIFPGLLFPNIPAPLVYTFAQWIRLHRYSYKRMNWTRMKLDLSPDHCCSDLLQSVDPVALECLTNSF